MLIPFIFCLEGRARYSGQTWCSNRREAQFNVLAFNDENRTSSADSHDDSKRPQEESKVEVPPTPLFPSCYGWLKIDNSRLPAVRPPFSRNPSGADFSIAIVYDYVDETPRDKNGNPLIDGDLVQSFLDYFYAVGFGFGFYCTNWRRSKLVDFNDITQPWDYTWCNILVHRWDSSQLNWYNCNEDPNAPINRYKGKVKRRRIVKDRSNPSSSIGESGS
ncbi:hypothetical protein F4810DRAFT_717377 [Camillea tinctor]|nr:hypothetical protein F4810DRAFT_717377 [Camillea tinctor]